MMKNPFDLGPDELFRLMTAYVAIRCPKMRAEFVELVEAWAQDQWRAGDKALAEQN